MEYSMNRKFSCILYAFCLVVLAVSAVIAHADVEGTVRGDVDMYLYRSGTGTSTGGMSDIQVTIGDTLSIDVFLRNPKQVQLTQLSLYFTVDDSYFKIVEQRVYDDGNFAPFIQGEYFRSVSGTTYPTIGNYSSGDKTAAYDNGEAGWQMNYIESTAYSSGQAKPSSNLRYGVACTFKLVAIGLCENSIITLDDDHPNRFARYNVLEAADSYYFRNYQSCSITVSGIEIDPPLEDMFLAPGTQDSTLDLDNHIGISSIPDSLFTWNYSGNNHIGVSIDQVKHVVTFTAPPTFKGYEDITFSVSGGGVAPSSDVMRVTVDSPPTFVLSALPDTLYIAEDVRTSVFKLDDVVSDADNTLSELEFDILPGSNLSYENVSNEIFLTGDENYYGNSSLTIRVSDPYEMTASITLPVLVTPVNDAPVISVLPAVVIERNDYKTIDLSEYISDPDDTDLTLSWAESENIDLQTSGLNLTVKSAEGYIGTEVIDLIVSDPSNLSDTGKLSVEITRATKKPVWTALPKIGLAQGTADSSLVLWDYVSDPDDDDSLLTFEITGADNIDFWEVNPHNGKLLLLDLNNRTGWDRLTITAVDPDGNMATTQTIAFVAPSDGTPIVGGIPDTTMVAGTQTAWIDLDDYYFDIDNTDSDMDWTWSRSADADSSATLYIDPASRVVTLRSISEESSGLNKIIFTVTDPTRKSADDVCNITVLADLARPVLNLPAKVGFIAGESTTLDLNSYVDDSMYDDDQLAWFWSMNQNATIEYESQAAAKSTSVEKTLATKNIVFSGPSSWIGWEKAAFTVTNPLGGAASDTLTVFSVSADGTPVAGGLNTISLTAGECVNVNLDDYFFDADSPDYAVQWTVSGNDSISVSIDPVTHLAQVCAHSETWQGQETLTFTVTDSDNKSDSFDTVVIVSGAVMRDVLRARLFRNPMQEDYIDIFVSSTLTLTGIPVLSVEAGEDTSAVSVASVSDGFYEGRYLLPYGLGKSSTGTADIIMKGVTDEGLAVQDSTRFAYGRGGAKAARLVLGDMTLDIAAGSLPDAMLITIIEDSDGDAAYKAAPGGIEIGGERYSIAPVSMQPDKAMCISWNGLDEVTGAGIYVASEGGWLFAGSDRADDSVSAMIEKSGTYALGYDLISPTIENIAEDDNGILVTLADNGCGIDPSSLMITCNGDETTFSYSEDTARLTIDADELPLTGPAVLMLTVSDRSGNTLVSNIESSRTTRPGVLRIMQNSPNPFNPATEITFDISSDGMVQVEVYDLLGRKVRTLSEGLRSAGNHAVVWNADDDGGRTVSSGVYIYRIIYAGKARTGKMTFIR